MSQAEKFFFLKRRQRVKNPPNRCGSSKGGILSFFLSLSAVVAVVFEQRTTAEKWHLPPFPPPSEPDAQFFRRVGEANSSPLSSFRCGNQDVFARCQGGFGLVFFSSLSTCDDGGGRAGGKKERGKSIRFLKPRNHQNKTFREEREKKMCGGPGQRCKFGGKWGGTVPFGNLHALSFLGKREQSPPHHPACSSCISFI